MNQSLLSFQKVEVPFCSLCFSPHWQQLSLERMSSRSHLLSAGRFWVRPAWQTSKNVRDLLWGWWSELLKVNHSYLPISFFRTPALAFQTIVKMCLECKHRNNLGNQKFIKREIPMAHLSCIQSGKDNSDCASDLCAMELTGWITGGVTGP